MVASIGQTSLPGFLNLFLKVMRGDSVKHDDVTKGLVLDTLLANMAPMMVSKPDASDPDLTAMLETWQEGNRLFTHIYLYKTSLTSASGGEESDVPNYIGVAHHEGVVMKHARREGSHNTSNWTSAVMAWSMQQLRTFQSFAIKRPGVKAMANLRRHAFVQNTVIQSA